MFRNESYPALARHDAAQRADLGAYRACSGPILVRARASRGLSGCEVGGGCGPVVQVRARLLVVQDCRTVGGCNATQRLTRACRGGGYGGGNATWTSHSQTRENRTRPGGKQVYGSPASGGPGFAVCRQGSKRRERRQVLLHKDAFAFL